MGKLFERLKKIVVARAEQSEARGPRRPDPRFVGRSSTKEIEQAPPERVGELVGHAVERVET